LGWIIVREAAAQVKGTDRAANDFRDCRWPAVMRKGKLSRRRLATLKPACDDSVKAFAAR
jgi:hypothetical protein